MSKEELTGHMAPQDPKEVQKAYEKQNRNPEKIAFKKKPIVAGKVMQ